MAYEKEILDLAEMSANRLSFTQNAKTGEREVTRGWKCVADERKATVLAYLDSIVTVTNPVVDKKELPGLWRVVASGWNGQAQQYFQTLRFGWATAIDIAECQIQAGTDSRSDARSYTFLWRNIASSAVDSCVEGLRATDSFVNPVIQGEVKDGAFSISEITPAQQQDGSYWITVNCLKVAVITAIGDLAALSPVRKDIHDIENPFGLEGGFVAHVGRKPTDGIALTFRALSMASRAVIMALTDGALQGLLSVSDKAKYEFTKRELNEDSGNTLTLALVYQYIPLATTITEESARYVGMTRMNQSNKIIIEISWPRINPTAIGAISEDALYKRDTVTDPVVEGTTYQGEYFVKTTEAPMTGNDGIRIVQKMTKAGDQKLNLIIGKDPDHKIYEFWRWDISAADIGEFMSETVGEAHEDPQFTWGVPQVGTTKMVDINKQADESFVLHAIYSDTDGLSKRELAPLLEVDPEGISGTPLEVRESFGKTTQNAFGWNVPIAYLRQYAAYFKPETAVVNQRNKFTISRQTEHVFDFQGERETFVPIDSGWLVVDDDDFKKVSVRAGVYVLKASLADTMDFGRPETVPPNTRYEQAFKENGMGSFDGQMTKTEFQEIDSGDIIIEDNAERTITRRKGEYILAANITLNFSRPADIDGTKVELDVKPTNVESFDAVKTTIVTKDQTTAGGKSGDLEDVAVVEHTSGATVPVTGGEANVEVEVIEDPTPGGKLKTKKVTTTKKAKTLVSAVITKNSAAESETLTVSLNGTTVTPAATGAGTYEDVDVSSNGAGGVNVVKRLITEKDQTTAGGESGLLRDVAVEMHTSGETVAVTGGAQNVKIEVDEAPTRGNKKRTKKVTETLKPWSSGTAVVVSDDGVTKVSQVILKNQTAAPSASANEEVKLGDNDLGGFNGVKLTKELAAGAAGTKAMHSSSVIDWDVSAREMRTSTWNTSTNSDIDAYITGYNNWRVSMSRSRTITTTITKTYTMTEPATLTADAAVPGGSEGAGTSYFKDARKVGDVWELIDKTIVTSGWSAWGNKALTWINWIQTTVGSGE